MASNLRGRVADVRKQQENGGANANGGSRPPRPSTPATPSLSTRKPTGVVPWPLILIEGGEKTGKSYSCAVLSASRKVGRTLWLDIGEGAADEYGAIPGARYEVIEHDGSWDSMIGQVFACKAEAQRAAAAGEPPVVLIVDSITAEWEMLKDWASDRACNSNKGRAILARDPNAEITVTMNLWNDATSRHRRLMTTLMTFPGIVVITARGGAVAAMEDGKPVEGKKSYRVEGHKSLAFDASLWIRLSHEAKPVVVGARSVHHGLRPGIDPPKTLDGDWTLESLIFDVLRCEPAKAHARDLVEPKRDALGPEEIRDEACDPRTGVERLKELWRLAKRSGYDQESLMNENGDEELLLSLLERLGRERAAASASSNGSEPMVEDPPADPWAGEGQ